MFCLSYCLLLTESQSETLASPSYNPDSAKKWAWFENNVGVVKKICAQPYILPPQPVASSYAYVRSIFYHTCTYQ